MDIIRQRHFLIGVIVLLVAMNLAMLAMMWMNRAQRAPAQESAQVRGGQPRIEEMLRDQLGFDQKQIDTYVGMRRAQQERMRQLNDRMRELKNHMFDDVLRDEPAPVLSDSMLALTQAVQNEIERITFEHLLNLKKICTPEQRLKLGGLIHEMFRSKPADARQAPPPGSQDRPPRKDGPPPPPRRDAPPPPTRSAPPGQDGRPPARP